MVNKRRYRDISARLQPPGPYRGLSTLLWLPAEPDEIEDALQRIRCNTPQSMYTVELRDSGRFGFLFDNNGVRVKSILDIQSLAERLDPLDDRALLALAGLVTMERRRAGRTKLSPDTVHNLICHIDKAQVHGAHSRRELGLLLSDGDSMQADYERIAAGALKLGTAALLNDGAVIYKEPFDQLYTPPEPYLLGEMATPRFELNDVPDKDGICYIHQSSIPQLRGIQGTREGLTDLILAAGMLNPRDSIVYKAMLEATFCSSNANAISLAQTVDQYTLNPEIHDSSQLCQPYLEKYLPQGHAEALLDIGAFARHHMGPKVAQMEHISVTPYGALSRRDGGPLPNYKEGLHGIPLLDRLTAMDCIALPDDATADGISAGTPYIKPRGNANCSYTLLYRQDDILLLTFVWEQDDGTFRYEEDESNTPLAFSIPVTETQGIEIYNLAEDLCYFIDEDGPFESIQKNQKDAGARIHTIDYITGIRRLLENLDTVRAQEMSVQGGMEQY